MISEAASEFSPCPAGATLAASSPSSGLPTDAKEADVSKDALSPRDSEGEVTGPQPPLKPSNRREFELALRHLLKFSKREAKFIAACGYSEGMAQAGAAPEQDTSELVSLLKQTLINLTERA